MKSLNFTNLTGYNGSNNFNILFKLIGYVDGDKLGTQELPVVLSLSYATSCSVLFLFLSLPFLQV